VVNAVRHGMTTSDISRHLGVSRDAVKYHVSNAREKLALDSRSELTHWHGAPRDSALAAGTRAMSDTATLGPIGQISRQVGDINVAVAWYRDVLGLPHLFTYGTMAFFDCHGTRLYLSQGDGGTGSTGDSILYFRTDNIQAMHRRLSEHGVTFKGAPHMVHRHDNGVEEWMAFFEDPDGKILALMSQVKP